MPELVSPTDAHNRILNALILKRITFFNIGLTWDIYVLCWILIPTTYEITASHLRLVYIKSDAILVQHQICWLLCLLYQIISYIICIMLSSCLKFIISLIKSCWCFIIIYHEFRHINSVLKWIRIKMNKKNTHDFFYIQWQIKINYQHSSFSNILYKLL